MRRLWLVFLLPLVARGGTSADYSIGPVVFDGGGVAGSSAAYSVNPSTAPGAAAASANYVFRSGYAGQLLDLAGIAIDEPPALNERASRLFSVSEVYDDASRAALPADRVLWSVQSGPLTGIDPGGWVTAGSVYQDVLAVARADYGNFSNTVSVAVVNTGLDDFGSYAADGLPDTWQVLYFGESGLQSAASADADYDGLSNLQEYAFGMNPSQASGGMLRWSGTNLLERGVPKPFASGTAGSFTFRAVFARRKDHVAAGLSYTVEFSGDLSSWKSSNSTPAVLADDGEVQVVSVPYPFFVNGKKATYFRVKVQSR